jgi:dihydrofolate reductase
MKTMPKKTKTPKPIRPELIAPLTEILRDQGLDVRQWPADEAAAYRDNGRFREGHDAAQKVKMAKAAAAIEEVFRPVIEKAFIEGVSNAQAMTGFTDETFQSILDKEGISLPAEPERPVRDERVVLIWAEAANGVIGAGGAIPWHLPEDLKHFHELTSGQPVIMGRRTWDSLPKKSRPLPGRTNIVITSQDEWAADGAVRASSLTDALEAADAAANPGDRIWIIGGRRLYQEAVHVAETAIITVLDLKVEGDTSAPALGRPWAAHRREPSEGWSVSADGTRYRVETWHPGL